MERNTRRKPGTILECIGDVESYSDCGKLLFAKGKQDTILLRIILLLLTCTIGGGLFYTMYDIKSIIGIIASLIAILCAVFYILFNNFEAE